ncbi:hypothetical protein Tco_1392373 [Tanacetum coccineum]
MGDANPIRTLRDYSKPSYEGYMNTIEFPLGNNVVPLRSDTIRTAKLRNDTPDVQQHQGGESFLRMHGLVFKGTYSKKSLSWHRSFGSKNRTQGISLSWSKAISLLKSLSTSDRRLIELENQVQRLMEAHLALMQPTQVNKITSSCEICSGPHDTQCCMENPKQAFVEYASSCTDEAGGTRDSRDSMAEEEEREREGDPKDTNTIAYNEEQRDTPQLSGKT